MNGQAVAFDCALSVSDIQTYNNMLDKLRDIVFLSKGMDNARSAIMLVRKPEMKQFAFLRFFK